MKRQNLSLAGAPALLVYQDDPRSAGERGTVLFYHGLWANKETNLKELESLAGTGLLAVGIDNVNHGERPHPDPSFRENLSKSGEFEPVFMDMVRNTVEEIPGIIAHLANQGFSRPDKIGVSGISMGGYITYGAILNEPRIKAAAPILGSPRWRGLTGDGSPHHHPDKFFPTAILSQNAGNDQHVLPVHARKLHEALSDYYAEAPDRHLYLEYPHSGHFMREKDWNEVWRNVLEWFNRFL